MSTRFSNYGEKSYTQICREFILNNYKEKQFCVFDIAKESGINKNHCSSALYFLHSVGMIKIDKIISSKQYNGHNRKTKLFSFVKDVEIRHNVKHKEHNREKTKSLKRGPKCQVDSSVPVEFVKTVYKSVSVSKRDKAKKLIEGMLVILAELDALLGS